MQTNNELLKNALSCCLEGTHFDFGNAYHGKVRDCYTFQHEMIMVTSDRLSAFDRILCTVPFKGQLLNLLSAWWFDQTKHIIPNAKLAVVHPNVMVMQKCKVFPVEFVMRGYMTGSTDTSLWAQYQKGLREYDGCRLPHQLSKNAMLPRPLLTPTTKSEMHDTPMMLNDIVAQKLMTRDELAFVSEKARALYAYGAAYAKQRGLILVDTKYEFGRNEAGEIVVLDELHTPDSSRYWQADTYQERFSQGLEPESYDKEMLRLWVKAHANPYADAPLPAIPDDIILQVAARYIALYERLTETMWERYLPDHALSDTIRHAILSYRGS